MMKTNKTNKILIGIIICLIFFVSLQTCKVRSGHKPITEITTVVDTTHVTHVDTTEYFKITDSIRWVNLPLISVTASMDSNEFQYITDITDSLIAGTVLTVVKSDGTLVQQDLTYLPKFPKYIRRTDTVWINKETTIKTQDPDWGIYGGMMVSPYKNFSIIPTLGLKTKKDMYFGVGYDPFNNNFYADFKIKLFNKN